MGEFSWWLTPTSGLARSGSLPPGVQQGTSEGSMKKANRRSKDDIRPEYDFASMKGGVRGKFVNAYRSGTNLVLLDPEVARAFPTDAAVNQALRAVLSVTKVARLPSAAPRKRGTAKIQSS